MQYPPEFTITCSSSSAEQKRKALLLSQQLQIPLVSHLSSADCYQLVYTDARLELQGPSNENNIKRWRLFTDFVGGSSGYRRSVNTTIHQPLAKAVGIKPGLRPTIVDATAGLGEDGFVFATLGCKVILIERSPIIAAILKDGIMRAALHKRTVEIVEGNMHLICGDSKSEIQGLSPHPHTVYLDPMYPHKKKAALNKKGMRMIRSLVGDDLDAEELFSTSLKLAKNRVVVKRPKGARTLSTLPPSHTIQMKNSRFDVYMVGHL